MRRVRTLCLGEALVDLVCERRVAALGEADAFVPHPGGATANVAVAAARCGADIALAGGAGDDPWGRWLRAGMHEGGVDLRWFGLVPGLATAIAFVVTDPDGEPSFQIYGDGIAATVEAVAPRLEEAIAACDALFFSFNTLVGERERQLTFEARERSLAHGPPVVFDPNLRLQRWPSVDAAVAAVNACVPGALLVRANRTEAELMTGQAEPERAAAALVAAGARMAVVTRGAAGALVRGEQEADVEGVPAQVRSAVGAGDALMGVLAARLTLAGFDPASVPAALPEAVAEGARATERWGALAPVASRGAQA